MPANRNRVSVFVALVACTLYSSSREVAAGPPRPRDVWYVFVANDQPYGYEHVTVRRQEDGAFSYLIETRLLLDLLGQRQEYTSKATYVVTPQYKPVSVDVESKGLSGTVRVQGRVEEEQLTLVYQRDRLQRTKVVDLSGGPIFSECFDDWLSGQSAETTTARCSVINESSLEVEPAVATLRQRDPSGAVWDVDFGPELGQGRIALDSDGIPRETELSTLRVHLRRAPAEEARDIRHRKLEGREILMFPVDKPIGPLQRLTSLTVRLTWENLPFERFHLTDGRQRVIRRSENNGRFEALVEIRPDEAPDANLGYPVEGDQFRPYLAETRFIKPEDPDILSQARAWVKDENTALGAVRALSAGVFKHMQGGSLVAETLSGPEVLHSKQGKCSEHSTLFASLARSVGIPTRIVLGMRIVGGSWVGHMWNEAYVGRWITVDTTANEVGSVPTLLKLVHSDTVLGTQPLRWAVTESLRVSVEDSQPPPSLAPGTYKTGIEGHVYTNAEFACRITAPDKSWSLEDVSKAGLSIPTIRFRIPKRDDVNVHFVALSVPAAFTPETLVEMREGLFKKKYQGYEVLKNEEYSVHQMKGRIFVFRRTQGEKDPTIMKTTEVLWSDGTTCFLLNLIADEASHDEYAADFFKLLNSFETFRETSSTTKSESSRPSDKQEQRETRHVEPGPNAHVGGQGCPASLRDGGCSGRNCPSDFSNWSAAERAHLVLHLDRRGHRDLLSL